MRQILLNMKKLKNSELNRLSVDEFKATDKTPFIIVLDNIRSLNNVGSVFRTSDAFKVEAIYLCGITATPPHKDIHKTALGATESVDWKHYKTTLEAIDELKRDGYQIVSIEQVENSIPLNEYQIDPNKKYALILGHEVKGVAQDVVSASDECIEIPQYGTKHSLNISVTTGVVIWDLFNKYRSQL